MPARRNERRHTTGVSRAEYMFSVLSDRRPLTVAILYATDLGPVVDRVTAEGATSYRMASIEAETA
jgi:hypothetical protein